MPSGVGSITISRTPTDLPKRLPLSPPTVFRYINGTATFYGGELSAAYRLAAYRLFPPLTAWLTGSTPVGRGRDSG